MLNTLLAAILLVAAPQADHFKREKQALQQSIDAIVNPVVGRLLYPSKATYLEGYGVVITLEVTLEQPRTPFSNPVAASEIQANVAQRGRELKQKISAFVTQRVAAMDSLAPTESLAVVVHILNTNPADVPNLPGQFVFSAKKETPQQVVSREF